MRLALFILAAAIAAAASASAQVPDLGGAIGGVVGPTPAGELGEVTQGLGEQVGQGLRDLREEQTRLLSRRHSDVIDLDRAGFPFIRNEVVAVAPSAAALESARARGFVVSETVDAQGLGLTLIVLRAPEGMSTRRALATLREIDPEGAYDYNHVYLGAGIVDAAPSVSTQQPRGGGGGGARIGLIDSGVATTHPALADASIRQRGFAGPQAVGDVHGTAVASLLLAADSDAPTIYVADVYGGLPTGGGASAIVSALSWLAQSGAGVINISLVGPPNRALEAGVRAAIARGHIIVAAVGNDGPSAPPLYPASYPGVIGVTGVDANNRALPEAGRGDQVDFAAPGSDLAAATTTGGFAPVRGTSFAAPIVAGLIARRLPSPSADAAASAQTQLAHTAADLGARGRDRTFGIGLVGEDVRASSRQLARR
ncbi:S8 family serine peptidase [Terricaulis sp.]|uniref:S8 family serine peptidase n=1 Tax=Terricaulis sp. TaxID=2768686 RepID=UPI003783EF8D